MITHVNLNALAFPPTRILLAVLPLQNCAAVGIEFDVGDNDVAGVDSDGGGRAVRLVALDTLNVNHPLLAVHLCDLALPALVLSAHDADFVVLADGERAGLDTVAFEQLSRERRYYKRTLYLVRRSLASAEDIILRLTDEGAPKCALRDLRRDDEMSIRQQQIQSSAPYPFNRYTQTTLRPSTNSSSISPSQTSTSNRPVPKLHNGRTFEGEHVLNLAAVVESCGGDALLDVFQRAVPFLGKLRQIQVVGLTCLLRVE